MTEKANPIRSGFAGALLCTLAAGCAAPPREAAQTGGAGEVIRSDAVRIEMAEERLDARRTPDRNFKLWRWKLTIPSGEDIQVAQLNSGYTLPGAFFSDPDSGGMVFRSPNRAGTTKNSKYSRSELREMRRPDKSAKDPANNWTTDDGGTLTARLRVDAVSTTGDKDKVGRVIIGQIHAPDSEVIRLYYHKRPDEPKGRIYAGLDDIKNRNTYSPDIIGNADGDGIALGEVFSYRIELHGTRLRVTVAPRSGPAAVYTTRVDAGYAGLDLYFKAGVYNQNNTGAADDYAQATFFALKATHP